MIFKAVSAEQFLADRFLAVPQRGMGEEREGEDVFAGHLYPFSAAACARRNRFGAGNHEIIVGAAARLPAESYDGRGMQDKDLAQTAALVRAQRSEYAAGR